MRRPSDWCLPHYADDYAAHDFPQFAQELLCRNPDYQDQYQAIIQVEASDPDHQQQELEGLARQWGMTFPLQPRRRPTLIASTLVPEPISGHHYHRRSASQSGRRASNRSS